MNQPDLFVYMTISAWETQNKRLDKFIETYSDEQWVQPTAPGRNTGHYLLGHLTAANDGIIPILGFGKRLHPELEAIFLANPENPGTTKIPLADLKSYWKEINATLDGHFKSMKAADWFTRHMSVSEEDFAKEPHRNKLNILLNRANHQSYHLGQLAYLAKK